MRGDPYKLWGLFEGDRHLFGLEDRDARFSLLGQDTVGRDLFTRVVFGARISLSIGLVGVAMSFFLGILLGGLSGYLGGIVDT